MCLSIPSQVVEVHEQDNSVTVDTMGVKHGKLSSINRATQYW